MPETISQQLDEVLREASATFVRGMLKTDHDRAEFKNISQGAAEKQDDLTRLYREEYGTRVDAIRQRLYDEAGRFKLDHPPPPGGSHDRAGAIDREAHRLVRQAHEHDLQRVRDEAQRRFEDLLEGVQRRDQSKGLAVEAFLRASDRRSGYDRRRSFNQSQD